jgi:hypothetical protein
MYFIVSFPECYRVNQIEENEIGETRSTHERDEKCIQNLSLKIRREGT